MKRRILNERLAAIVASIRHGEMLFIADSGSGTCSKALYPLDPSAGLSNFFEIHYFLQW